MADGRPVVNQQSRHVGVEPKAGTRMKFVTALFAVLPALASAQIDDGQAVPITGAANPAISPDGSRIAFRYRGDVWIVSAGGGTAVRITDHVEMDDMPVWSPDGKWVAFTSDRFGSPDVFAIPRSEERRVGKECRYRGQRG